MGCLTFPFLAASIAYTLTEGLLGLFFVSPVLARLWRRRRLLADATAVELTRNPDALVTALQRMEERGANVPPGPWAHLFFVGPEVRQDVAKRRMLDHMQDLRDEGRRSGESRAAYVRRRMQESSAAQQEYGRALDEATADTAKDSLVRSGLDRFLPSVDKRLRRLEALGAQVPASSTQTPPRPERPSTRGAVATALLWTGGAVLATVLVTLLVACGLMILACLVGLIYIALMFEALLVVVPVLLVNAWLR
jgi:hypothetical protein